MQARTLLPGPVASHDEVIFPYSRVPRKQCSLTPSPSLPRRGLALVAVDPGKFPLVDLQAVTQVCLVTHSCHCLLPHLGCK